MLAELTFRQLDIVRLVAEGLTNNEVSIRLNLCEKTIRNTLHLIFTNTYVTNRTQLARLVWEAGL